MLVLAPSQCAHIDGLAPPHHRGLVPPAIELGPCWKALRVGWGGGGGACFLNLILKRSNLQVSTQTCSIWRFAGGFIDIGGVEGPS